MAAAEGEAGDADGGAGAAGDRQTAAGEALVDVDELGARADRAVRPDAGQRRDVDDEASVPARPARVRVTAAADGDGGARAAGEGQALTDVRLVPDVGDGRGLQTVEAGVVELTGGRIGGVLGPYETAVEALGQGGEVRRSGGGGLRRCRWGAGGARAARGAGGAGVVGRARGTAGSAGAGGGGDSGEHGGARGEQGAPGGQGRQVHRISGSWSSWAGRRWAGEAGRGGIGWRGRGRRKGRGRIRGPRGVPRRPYVPGPWSGGPGRTSHRRSARCRRSRVPRSWAGARRTWGRGRSAGPRRCVGHTPVHGTGHGHPAVCPVGAA